MRHRPRALLFASTLSILASGCGGDPASPTGAGGSTSTSAGGAGGTGTGGAGGAGGTMSTGGSGGTGPTVAPIVWTPCPLDSNATNGADAECAEIPVPAKWDDPSAGNITFFVKRRLGDKQPSRGQVWFLNGGPGYAGSDFEPLVKSMAAVDKTIDLYMPDHRGVGRSSRLSCPQAEDDASEEGRNISVAEMPACLALLKQTWGDKLDGFSITNAARDVGEVIARTRAPGAQVLVYGGSYGTSWAHRYMQIYPDQPTGVILDAIAINAPLSSMNPWFDQLGKRFLDRCGADAACSARLGADPWAAMTDALDAFDQGACPEVAAMGFDRRLFQVLFASFFYARDQRTLIPPTIYRLARCGPADVNAFANLAAALEEPPPSAPVDGFFSQLLSTHVVLSELWDPSVTAADIESFRDHANVSHSFPTELAAVAPGWPRYPLDAYDGPLVDFAGPVLMLHGEFDFLPMSINDPVKAKYSGPLQTFVELPTAPHGSFQSPLPNGNSCGIGLFKQFVDDPMAGIDPACTANVTPLSFDVASALSLGIFGVSDEWDGDPGPPSPSPPPGPHAAVRIHGAETLRAALRARRGAP